jgi:hypothetical protein
VPRHRTFTVPTIPGWIVQRYGNVPADENVLLNWPPGAIGPDAHEPSFEVESCVLVSLFVHVIVAPVATSIGFGANAVVVSSVAPLTIDTMPGVADVGGVDGDDGDDGEELPQPAINPSSNVAIPIRKVMSSASSGGRRGKLIALAISVRIRKSLITDGLRNSRSGYQRRNPRGKRLEY